MFFARLLGRGAPAWMVGLALVLSSVGCLGDGAGPPGVASSDWARGRKIYLARCVACHNTDPSKSGSVGPAVSDSSEDLLRARLLQRAYPPGYARKRATKIMPVFSSLENEIPYLAVYLHSATAPRATQ